MMVTCHLLVARKFAKHAAEISTFEILCLKGRMSAWQKLDSDKINFSITFKLSCCYCGHILTLPPKKTHVWPGKFKI